MTRPTDLRDYGLSGTALTGEVVIDAHMHVGRYYNFLMPHPEPARLIESAGRIGIQRMYGSSLAAIRGDAASGNKEALAIHAEYPEKFFPYFVFSPTFPEIVRETLDIADAAKIGRFKIHDDGNDVAYDDDRYLPLYEYANGSKAVILAHTWGSKHVEPLKRMAARFPAMTILLGHSGITEESVYAEAVRQHDNIYLETCSSLAWYGLIERLVAMAGADRVLFGTDMPFMSPDQQIGRILFARISDEEKRKVLGLNAQRILT